MLRLAARLWAPVEVRAEMAAPPDLVFSVLSDPTTYPEWLVGAQRIRAVDPDFPKPGSEFHHSVGAPGATMSDVSEVIEVAAPHHLALDVHVGPARGRVDFSVEPAPVGAEVRFLERPSGPASILTPLLRPVLRARNEVSLRQLADYVVTRAS